jgi:hypothetical protein
MDLHGASSAMIEIVEYQSRISRSRFVCTNCGSSADC